MRLEPKLLKKSKNVTNRVRVIKECDLSLSVGDSSRSIPRNKPATTLTTKEATKQKMLSH